MELTPEQVKEAITLLREAFPDAEWSPDVTLDKAVDLAKRAGLKRRYQEPLAASMHECDNAVCRAWAEVVEDVRGVGVAVMVSGSTAAVKMRDGWRDYTWKRFVYPFVGSQIWPADVKRSWVPVSVRLCPEHLSKVLDWPWRLLVLADDVAVKWWREGQGVDGEGAGCGVYRGLYGFRYPGVDGGNVQVVYVWDRNASDSDNSRTANGIRVTNLFGARTVIASNGYKCVACGGVMHGWDPQGIPFCRAHMDELGFKPRLIGSMDGAVYGFDMKYKGRWISDETYGVGLEGETRVLPGFDDDVAVER